MPKTNKIMKLLIKNSSLILKIFIIIYILTLLFLTQAVARGIALYTIPFQQLDITKDIIKSSKQFGFDEINNVYFLYDGVNN